MAAFHVITADPLTAVANGGTFTLAYPSGTNRLHFYGKTGHKLAANGAVYLSASSHFSVSFGTSDITVTWSRDNALSAGSRVRVELQARDLDTDENWESPVVPGHDADKIGRICVDSVTASTYQAHTTGTGASDWTLTGDSGVILAELAYLDGLTPGTAAASKAVVLDSTKGIDTIRFGNTGLLVEDTGGDHTTAIKQNSNEAANRTLNIPALGGDDTIVTLATAQTIDGVKTMSGANVITHAPTGMKIQDSDASHVVTIAAGNEAADRTLSLPVLGGADTVMTLATAQTITGLKSIITALGDTDQFIVRNVTEGYFFNTSAGLAEIVGYDGGAANDLGFRPGSMGAGAGMTITGTSVNTNTLQLSVGDTTTGSSANLKAATTLLSAMSGATVTATGLIPAGVKLLGVVARVTTPIATATSFAIGDGTDVDRWGNAIAVAAGTVTDQDDFTADPEGTWSASARNVVLTAAGGNFSAGAVRVTAYYHDFTAPTS